MADRELPFAPMVELAGPPGADPLLSAFELVGISPDEVVGVVVSHFHNDHSGGLRWFAGKVPVKQVLRLMKSGVALAIISDVLGYSLPLPLDVKQELLAAHEVERRVELLLDCLESHAPPAAIAPAGGRPFPPDFSPN